MAAWAVRTRTQRRSVQPGWERREMQVQHIHVPVPGTGHAEGLNWFRASRSTRFHYWTNLVAGAAGTRFMPFA
jgi:hypothetical protein